MCLCAVSSPGSERRPCHAAPQVHLTAMRCFTNGFTLPAHVSNMWDLYEEYWLPFGQLLTDMEAAGVLVNREHLAKAEVNSPPPPNSPSPNPPHYSLRHTHACTHALQRLSSTAKSGLTVAAAGGHLSAGGCPERPRGCQDEIQGSSLEAEHAAPVPALLELPDVMPDAPLCFLRRAGWRTTSPTAG